jgi:hypothetical protein
MVLSASGKCGPGIRRPNLAAPKCKLVNAACADRSARRTRGGFTFASPLIGTDKAVLASPEAKRYLVDLPIDYTDGSRRSRGSRESFVEHFRIGTDGKIKETQYQLASREAPSRPRKEGRIHRREKALGGCVLPSPRSEEVMALGAGAASVVRR